MQNRENDIVLFMDENIQLEVPVSQDRESVWLSANQMAVLFDKDETNIRKHINNIFKSSEVDKNNNTQKMRVDKYNIRLSNELREDVRIMCNLNTGIEEKATEKATEKTSEKFILNMYKKGYTSDQIADVAETSVAAVEAVIKKKEPAMA